MFLVYISLSILSFAAALFFLTLTMQPADDARYTAMDLFLALLFQVLSAWLLVQLPAVAAVTQRPGFLLDSHGDRTDTWSDLRCIFPNAFTFLPPA